MTRKFNPKLVRRLLSQLVCNSAVRPFSYVDELLITVRLVSVLGVGDSTLLTRTTVIQKSLSF